MMTFGQFIIAYIQQSKTDINTFAKFINSTPAAVQNWMKNIGLPPFKVRCAILLKLNKTMGNPKLITIKDSDGFSFELKPKMATKYQNQEGRQKYYESARWNKLEQKVFDRAGYKCEICGCKGYEDGSGLCVHHMLYDEDFGTGKEDLDVLICLCNKCHKLLHAADNEYKQKQYDEYKDGKYKILIVEKTNEYKTFLFTNECTDAMIIGFFKKMYGKFKNKPKYRIMEF